MSSQEARRRGRWGVAGLFVRRRGRRGRVLFIRGPPESAAEADLTTELICDLATGQRNCPCLGSGPVRSLPPGCSYGSSRLRSSAIALCGGARSMLSGARVRSRADEQLGSCPRVSPSPHRGENPPGAHRRARSSRRIPADERLMEALYSPILLPWGQRRGNGRHKYCIVRCLQVALVEAGGIEPSPSSAGTRRKSLPAQDILRSGMLARRSWHRFRHHRSRGTPLLRCQKAVCGSAEAVAGKDRHRPGSERRSGVRRSCRLSGCLVTGGTRFGRGGEHGRDAGARGAAVASSRASRACRRCRATRRHWGTCAGP